MTCLNTNDFNLLAGLVRKESKRQDQKRDAAARRFGAATDFSRIDERKAYLNRLHRKLVAAAREENHS